MAAGTPTRRFHLRGRSLRQHAARGTIVNSAFLLGVTTLTLLKGFAVAGFLARAEYGVWGVLTVSLGTLLLLKPVGVADKYIQQDDPDQQLAFQQAFSLELLVAGAFTLLIAAAAPVVALVYGEAKLLVPGLVIALIVPGLALQAPLWVFYRRMEFRRQRALQAIDPIVGFAVTVALVAGGAGYWGLIFGTLAGTWSAAAVALLACPYPPRLRLRGLPWRSYVAFSWPIMAAGASGVVIAQGTILAGEAKLGLAGAGVIALASQVIQYTDKVDQIITQTLYPAIAAVKARRELLFESFVKSNRLALMWGAPFGIGLALFADPLVQHVIGGRWEPAVGLLQVFGVLAAVNHIGFNWTAYYRASGDTGPLAVAAALTTVAFLALTLPALIAWGLDGLAGGMAAMIAVSLTVRAVYVVRLFPGFKPLRHALRALGPVIPAALAVLLVRVLGAGGGALAAALEFALFLTCVVAATWAFERPLLREAVGYLRARPA